jgi:DNA repair exonuclease SbcCD ATPase subunit
MFVVKDLTVKNFMSVGNATQAVKFNRNDLTLVLGQNLDLGGDDTGARNGTGKTTIINALSYALYGEALTKIRKENLINKTNGKAMMVTIEFEKDGQSYKIERGRKPNTLKFFVGDVEQEIKDEAQGDSRETQAAIENMLGMSHDMFKHIVALNTYTEPFLSLKAAEQRVMIEQLLGVTQLSEKAEALKEQMKATKESITKEEYRIKAVQDANKRMEDQIANLKRRQKPRRPRQTGSRLRRTGQD